MTLRTTLPLTALARETLFAEAPVWLRELETPETTVGQLALAYAYGTEGA